MTGRSEVDVQYNLTSQVGSSLSADGMHPGLQFQDITSAALSVLSLRACFRRIVRPAFAVRSALVAVLFLCLSSAGTITGGYFLMQGKSDLHEISLFVGSGSIGGYLHQIEWDQRHIIYTRRGRNPIIRFSFHLSTLPIEWPFVDPVESPVHQQELRGIDSLQLHHKSIADQRTFEYNMLGIRTRVSEDIFHALVRIA
jgi:hypothetical protein